VVRIAIAADVQVVPERLPRGAFDVSVQVIVTPSEVIRAAQRRPTAG
jgi:5-formyltetrahydrofolate cyclo-ligase